jgi:ribonuclease/clavin/mitogillin
VGTGRHRILIDTGEGRPSWIKALQEVLLAENATITQALITHWHHDHVGGINQLLKIDPNIRVYKHQPDDNQINIVDGDRFSQDGTTLHAVFSPGHTQDHMVFLLEEEDAMFTGDNVLGHGTAVFEDLSSYLKSLKTMGGLFSDRAYPGHGPVIDNGKSKISEYIRHRQLREDQVLDVLRSSPSDSIANASALGEEEWTSMEIVKVIYKDIPESLHLPAHGGIMQVLWKLQEEDKVAENHSTGKWRIRSRPAL